MGKKVVMSFSMSFQPYQGRYLRVYNQATTLAKEGYHVTLLSWDREVKWPQQENRDGINIKRFRIPAPVAAGPRKNLFNMLRFNWRVLKYLMSADYDIAHCYNLDAVVVTLLAAKIRRKRCVLDLCEPEYYALWDERFSALLKIVNFTEAFLARRYDHVLVHNLYQVEKFKSKGVHRVSQVGSYPNLYMVPKDDEGQAKQKSRDTVVIGRIGTFYQDNGVEELIAAFERLLHRQQNSDNPIRFRLLLAGRVWESYQQDFNKLVEPLKEHIDVHGPFESTQMHKLYEQIDISVIFVRVTKWFRNITPTKLFDSMANGVPVVGNDIGEVKQIVEEGPCGVIVDEADPDSICEGFEFLARDPETRRRMCDASRKLAKEKYTWEAYRDTFVSVYQDLSKAS